jgi:hypothetical protein
VRTRLHPLARRHHAPLDICHVTEEGVTTAKLVSGTPLLGRPIQVLPADQAVAVPTELRTLVSRAPS